MSDGAIGNGNRGGGGSGAKKRGGFADVLRSVADGLLEGFVSGTVAGGGRGHSRRDPVAANERPQAARQVQRSLSAWSERGSEPASAPRASGSAVHRKLHRSADESAVEPAASEEPTRDDAAAQASSAVSTEGEAEGQRPGAADGNEAAAVQAEEKPTRSVAAKLKGIHRKIFRTEAPGAPPEGGKSREESLAESTATRLMNDIRTKLPVDFADAFIGNVLSNRARQVIEWKTKFPNNSVIKEYCDLVPVAKEQIRAVCEQDCQTLNGRLAAIDATPLPPDAGNKLTAIKTDPLLGKWKVHILHGIGKSEAHPALVALVARIAQVEARVEEEAKKRAERPPPPPAPPPQAPAPARVPSGPQGMPAPTAASASQQAPPAGTASNPQELELQQKLEFCRARIRQAAQGQELIQKVTDLVGGKLTDVALGALATAITTAVFGPAAGIAAGLVIGKIIKEIVATPVDGLNASVEKVRTANAAAMAAGVDALTPEQLDKVVEAWANEPVSISSALEMLKEQLQVKSEPEKIWEEVSKSDVELKKLGKARGVSSAMEALDKVFQAIAGLTNPWIPGMEDLKKAKDVWTLWTEIQKTKAEIKDLQTQGVGAPAAPAP